MIFVFIVYILIGILIGYRFPWKKTIQETFVEPGVNRDNIFSKCTNAYLDCFAKLDKCITNNILPEQCETMCDDVEKQCRFSNESIWTY